MRLEFIPHIGQTSKPFKYESEDANKVKYMAVMLSVLQNFLTIENHSGLKANLKIFNDKNQQMDFRLINDVNNDPLYEEVLNNIGEEPIDTPLLKYIEKDGIVLMSYYPQVPCKPFHFPVPIVDLEEFQNVLGMYNNYLFEEKLRVDYTDEVFATFYIKDTEELIDFDSVYEETKEEILNEYLEQYNDYGVEITIEQAKSAAESLYKSRSSFKRKIQNKI